MAKSEKKKQTVPRQSQKRQPGRETKMVPRPEDEARYYRAAGKLAGKVALISGGDSGIGKAVAIHFAREGADVAILYLNETEDAVRTASLVEKEGRRALLIRGDIGDRKFCLNAVKKTLDKLGKLDILVNNAAEQHYSEEFDKVPPDQFERTFRTNVFGMFHLTQASLPRLKSGASIINTTSVTAFRGSPHLVDYASTKGAILAFTRALSGQLVEKGIRVNAVAPGPVWTPLIPSSFPPDKVAT